MKPGRRTFVKSICLLTGGTILLGSKVYTFGKNRNSDLKKEKKQCTSIYCKYNNKKTCTNQNLNNG